MPFVVTTFKDKLGMVHEATIDMGKIRKAIEFMTRKMKCPVYGTERYFYRFCNEIQFHSDNLSQCFYFPVFSGNSPLFGKK